MKHLYAAAAVLLILLSGCARDSDVLATYNGGSITRGDFMTRLRIRQLSMDVFRNRKEYQKKELEMMGLDRIAVMEAEKQGFDKSGRFMFLWSDVRDRYLCTYLLEDIIKERGYREDTVKVSHIVFKIYGSGPGEGDRVLKMAEEVIKKLENGASFSDMALKYSADPARDNGGEVGYIISGMLPDKYTAAAFSLKKGDFTHRPVFLKKRKRVFIIRADDRAVLTPDSIDRIIKGEALNRSIRKIITRKIKNSYIEELKNASDVTFDTSALRSGKPDAVVFRIGSNTSTADDIRKRAHMIRNISNAGRYSNVKNFNENVAERYFYSELLKREALKRGIESSEAYIRKIKEIRDFYLAGEYIEYISSSSKKVSDREIRDEYSRNLYRIYYRDEIRSGKKVRVPKPFRLVRSGIEDTLSRMKGAKAKSEWMTGKLKEYNFVINMDELQGE